jgi:predicted RNase H-like HicB family nuclease
MKYIILLTEKSEGGIHVSVPALPDCTVEADTRDDAIRLAREAIAAILSRSEVVQVEVSQPPKAPQTRADIPWEWFGAAKDDVTWDALFDEIEANREATRGAKEGTCIFGTPISCAILAKDIPFYSCM